MLFRNGGFSAGYTYSVKLLSTALKFLDTRFSDKDSMSFTVNIPEIMNVVEKNNIRVIEDFPLMTFVSEYTLTANLSHDFSICIGDIVKIPGLNYGFKVQRVFVALSIIKNGERFSITFREATVDEIYEEISADNVHIRYRNQPAPTDIPIDALQIILDDEKDIAADLANSDHTEYKI